MKSVAFKPFIPVGTVVKTVGVAGDVVISLDPDYQKDTRKTHFLWFSLDGVHIPFQIHSMDSYSDDSILLNLKQVQSLEEAKTLVNRTVYLPEGDVELTKEDHEEYVKFKGFSIVDIDSGAELLILKFVEYPKQLLAICQLGDLKKMIPFHENLIEKVDDSAKIIRMNLPKGLLDL